MQNKKWPYSTLILHRGGGYLAPENTLSALQIATQYQIKMVEFDVKISSDHQAFLFHDSCLDRTTNGHGDGRNLLWKDWQQFDAGGWFSAAYQWEKVPLLEEVIIACRQRNLMANIELKPYEGDEKITAQKVAEILLREWDMDPLPLISSFAPDALRAIKDYAPHYPRGFLLHEWDEQGLILAEELSCVSLHMNAEVLTQKRVEEIKKAGFYLLTYTVNNQNDAQRLLQWGVDSICTDDPALLSSDLSESK